MRLKLHAITFDCHDPQKLANWWSKALDKPIGADYGFIVALQQDSGEAQWLFQKIEDVPTQRNRVHPDFSTSELEGETKRLVELGAVIVEKFNLPEVTYTTFADPEGNKFDVAAERK